MEGYGFRGWILYTVILHKNHSARSFSAGLRKWTESPLGQGCEPKRKIPGRVPG